MVGSCLTPTHSPKPLPQLPQTWGDPLREATLPHAWRTWLSRGSDRPRAGALPASRQRCPRSPTGSVPPSPAACWGAARPCPRKSSRPRPAHPAEACPQRPSSRGPQRGPPGGCWGGRRGLGLEPRRGRSWVRDRRGRLHPTPSSPARPPARSLVTPQPVAQVSPLPAPPRPGPAERPSRPRETGRRGRGANRRTHG